MGEETTRYCPILYAALIPKFDSVRPEFIDEYVASVGQEAVCLMERCAWYERCVGLSTIESVARGFSQQVERHK